MKRYSNIMIL